TRRRARPAGEGMTIMARVRTGSVLIGLTLAVMAADVRSAWAEFELSGSWAARNHEDALERGGGPYAVDYTGIPINNEARLRALSYSANQLSLIERQCGLWPQVYLWPGPSGMQIWNENNP